MGHRLWSEPRPNPTQAPLSLIESAFARLLGVAERAPHLSQSFAPTPTPTPTPTGGQSTPISLDGTPPPPPPPPCAPLSGTAPRKRTPPSASAHTHSAALAVPHLDGDVPAPQALGDALCGCLPCGCVSMAVSPFPPTTPPPATEGALEGARPPGPRVCGQSEHMDGIRAGPRDVLRAPFNNPAPLLGGLGVGVGVGRPPPLR